VRPAAVCIAGMHRTGTSMVTRALNVAGIYLGEAADLFTASSDNPEGYWEHRQFVELNEEILDALGGSWDSPPSPPSDWLDKEPILRLRRRADALVSQFGNDAPWGWKDPRNSLTMPFWRAVVPHVKFVVCVRNPLEVALSLQRRALLSKRLSLSLWKTYNERILESTEAEARVVTAYDSFFDDPVAEVRRILEFLGVSALDDSVEASRYAVNWERRHGRCSARDVVQAGVASDVVELYERMLAEAGAGGVAASRRPRPTSRNERDVTPGPQPSLADDPLGAVSSGALPRDATVLVVSKGDDELLALPGRRGWHFPQMPDGTWAGYYPAKSAEAIAHLEALRARGGQFLLFPPPSLWWLEHYGGFRRHLESRYREVGSREGACVIFDLRTPGPAPWPVAFEEAVEALRKRLGREPAILDWRTGLDLADAFPHHLIFSPPDDGQLLPYLDETIDIVASTAGEGPARAEAARVATAAVATFLPQRAGGRPTARRNDHELTVHWKIEVSGVPPPSISMIIACCTAPANLDGWLRSLCETLPTSAKGEIVLVEDLAPDEIRAKLRALAGRHERIRIVRNVEGPGLLGSYNQGAQSATGELLVFLGNDTVLLPGWLPPLLRTFRDHPDAGAVGGKLLFEDGRPQAAGGVIFSDGTSGRFRHWDPEDAPLLDGVREADYCPPGVLATRRRLFLETGGFDVGYESGSYHAYADYCFAVRSRGLRAYYEPLLAGVALGSAPPTTDSAAAVRSREERSRARLVEKWSRALRNQPQRPEYLDASGSYPPTPLSARYGAIR
jgi:hypothetical protein